MIRKASIVLSLVLCVLCERRFAVSEQKVELRIIGHHGDVKHAGHQKRENHGEYAKAYPSYEFSYKVDDPHTHDNKAQQEKRDGGKVTGNYWLMQPDGEKRYIKYQVDDKSGFTAVINYTSPHSSVYYIRSKHHEEDSKNEAKKQEEKIIDKLQDVHQEVKIPEPKKEEIGINVKEDQNHKESSHEGNQEADGHDVIEKSSGKPDGQQHGGDGNAGRKEEGPDIGNNEGKKEAINEHSDNVADHLIDKDVNNNHENNNEGIGEEAKGEKQSAQNLWARFPSFNIIQNSPKIHEIPVWEKNDDPEHSLWSGVHTWNKKENKDNVESRDVTGNIIVEEIKGKENEEKKDSKDKLSNSESIVGEEKKEEEKRQIVNEKNFRDETRGRENMRGRVVVIQERRGRIQRRGGEEKRSSLHHRQGEERKNGQESWEGIERREYRHRRGGENRGKQYYQGQPSYIVNYKPTPYGQRH